MSFYWLRNSKAIRIGVSNLNIDYNSNFTDASKTRRYERDFRSEANKRQRLVSFEFHAHGVAVA